MPGKRSDILRAHISQSYHPRAVVVHRPMRNYPFRSRNSLHLFVRRTKRSQRRQSRPQAHPPRVKIVIMKLALVGRRISKIDMPPQAVNTKTMVYVWGAAYGT